MMATTPNGDKRGFDDDADALPEQDDGANNTPAEDRLPEDENSGALDDAQEEAAEERKEGGYQ